MFRKVCTAFVLLLFAVPAWGLVITPTGGTSGGNPGGQPLYEVSDLMQGDAFNVAWGGVDGLSATAMVIIEELTDTTADIRVMLDNNNTPIGLNGDPRITSFGIEVDDFDDIANENTGGSYLTTADDGNFPGFNIDVCGTSGNNCAGGGSGGIPAGDSDDFMLLLLLGDDFGGKLTLRNFALKVQGGPDGDSFELAGVPSEKVVIPEPGTLLLLGSGMVGAGLWRWRRSKRS